MMFDEISDEILEARLEELKVRDSKLSSAKGHKVVRLCTNPECKEALVCEPRAPNPTKSAPLFPSRASAKSST
jgi:hypothetical protein